MKTVNDFANSFTLPSNGFSAPVIFSDGFGFSTIKDRRTGGKDYASLYKFYLHPNVVSSANNLKPISISASYGEKLSDGSIRLEPSEVINRFSSPIELYSTDDYYFDINSGEFSNKKGKVLPADTILKQIDALHTKPTKKIRGAYLRAKLLFVRVVVTGSLEFSYHAIIKLLYIISGIRTTTRIWLVNERRDGFENDELEVRREQFATEKINILGYSASAWSVVLYALIHLIAFTLWYLNFQNLHFVYVETLFGNAFLTLAYVIPTLVLFERIIPALFMRLITYIGLKFQRFSMRKIKI